MTPDSTFNSTQYERTSSTDTLTTEVATTPVSPKASLASKRVVIEWPTLALFVSVYGLWGVAIASYQFVSWWVLLPAMAVLTCLHSSLQHEALHGHPTRSSRVNECLAAIPLGLFIPYRRFKRLHLRHHCDQNLTDPYDDPESFYLAQRDWLHLPLPLRWLLQANNTLLGRLTLGPALALFAFFREEAKGFSSTKFGKGGLLTAWLLHATGVLAVVLILVVVNFPIWLYLVGVAYPAMSLLMLRTYAEHQAAEAVGPRTAIVEASPFFALLFLNNNLHFVHHRFPNAPWYQLPKLYRIHYVTLSLENGHYRIAGYGAVFKRYFLRGKEPVAHPLRHTQSTIPSIRKEGLNQTVLPGSLSQ